MHTSKSSLITLNAAPTSTSASPRCGKSSRTPRAPGGIDTLSLALTASGCDRATVYRRPWLLSDNGPCYVAGGLADWLSDQNMEHPRSAPSHPQTQRRLSDVTRR
jgi:putative transposase